MKYNDGMSRKRSRVRFDLDSKEVSGLSSVELQTVLRAADDLIMRGGRTLLAKVLKGSRSKDVLSASLQASPAYGYYRHLPQEEVLARIDWVILNGYLGIEYSGRLPLLVYTPRGWAIEKETYAAELFQGLRARLSGPQQASDMSYLKDRNREVIWRLLDLIEASGDPGFIPLLAEWERLDYKKVRQRIRQLIERLSTSTA
jgi:hypothetical protein